MHKILNWIVEALITQDAREERFYCGRCGCYVLVPDRHRYHANGAPR